MTTIALKELGLDAISAIGFDMDETLALYRRDVFQDRTIASALEKLVVRGYRADITTLTYDIDFGMRGLLVDRQRGNVLKLGRDGAIEHAFHGLRRLTAEEIAAAYRGETAPSPGLAYATIETFFSRPVVVLFATLIDAMTSRAEVPRFDAVLHDVISAVNEAIHEANPTRPPAGALHADEALQDLLATLRADGKKVFLLTNSNGTYAQQMMSWLLSPTWYSFFDIAVVDAHKPAFFTETEPFVPDLAPNVFARGHARALERLLDTPPERILFFGDHPLDDVIVPREHAGWHTVLIAPELEEMNTNPYWGESAHVHRRRVEKHATMIAARVGSFFAR